MRSVLSKVAASCLAFGLLAGAAPGASQPAASVVFADDFETDLKQWDIQACPNGVTISSDVARTGNHSAKFVVSDGDTKSKCSKVPTDNPRAQLVSKGLFKDGDEFYIAFSVFFPKNFPKVSDWFQLAELYGPPFSGSPTMGVDVCSGNRICFQRDQMHSYDNIWQSQPIVLGAWRDIVLHVKFSTDAGTGFVEIWDNGQQQKLSNGQTRVNYQALNPKVNWNGTPNSLFINEYRSSDGKLGTVKVGTSFQAVAPPARSTA